MNLCVADNAVEPPGPYEREPLFSALVSEAAPRAAKHMDSHSDCTPFFTPPFQTACQGRRSSTPREVGSHRTAPLFAEVSHSTRLGSFPLNKTWKFPRQQDFQQRDSN